MTLTAHTPTTADGLNTEPVTARRAKFVCTLGPATATADRIRELGAELPPPPPSLAAVGLAGEASS
ncbi:hypothetical protein JWS13_15360 [Rhodococcus pseudokoreensis]|uniref:Uncharacterized protein n=1 Tax=Rhodococcus pseudokoreensis TaxID=2811421 RepID=A0A974W3D4_9NOCA|nr:hypothetical protein [Rhodococcus pseudokoreensis]QSE89902.1 hypothetical protein JWS13_15360 [Rhodococcus pseudokoreensis]